MPQKIPTNHKPEWQRAVKKNIRKNRTWKKSKHSGCSGSNIRKLSRNFNNSTTGNAKKTDSEKGKQGKKAHTVLICKGRNKGMRKK
jgi:hypothetical protein